jgi:hypothetical protein
MPSGFLRTLHLESRRRRVAVTAPLLLFLAASACALVGGNRQSTSGGGEMSGAKWVSLFDGLSLTGWHNFKKPGRVPEGWQVIEGAITRTGEGGDLVTNAEYANFELALDWRVHYGGNSGVMFRIDPAATVTYESGPEMQVLDDAGHADGKSRLTAAGAAYGLYPAPQGVAKGAESWNSARLVVNGAHVEHWLNGVKIIEYELWSDDWERRVRNSKFAQWPGYGRAKRGHIALQDHGDRVSFRNIRIRELP